MENEAKRVVFDANRVIDESERVIGEEFWVEKQKFIKFYFGLMHIFDINCNIKTPNEYNFAN